MSTKKKPPSRPSGPKPLLKLKFEKFPEKPVSVYFETTKRCFYADFGFEQYESPSVAGLEQKIKAAIKAGVTPSPVWVPMIAMAINIHHGRSGYKQALDLNFDIDIEREYYCIGRGGKLMSCGWEVSEKSRSTNAQEVHGPLAQMKPRALNAAIYKADRSSYDAGAGVDVLIPYTDLLWKETGEQVRALRAQAANFIHHVAAGKLEIFTSFIFDFDRSLKPQAKKPAPKKAASTKPENRPLFPLAAAAEKPIVTGKLSPGPQLTKQARKTARRHIADRGDNSAREHLVVKYQGKQLTLGHGPLGNYLVEALRKTYPEIHSAFCLKDNQVQISLRGIAEPLIITGKAFETVINHPPAGGPLGTQSILVEYRGTGAIAKLHELVDAMQPEDPPLVIPGLILLAAGFPTSATADMHSPDEIIIRVPKKAPQFISLFAFEEKIRQRIPAEPQKEQASA
jgi:hypothetical protein